MADEATDDEEDGKEGAAPGAEAAAAAAESTANKAGRDGAGAISDELLKLRLEAAPEEAGEEAEGVHGPPEKETVPVKEGGPEAPADGDGEVSSPIVTCRLSSHELHMVHKTSVWRREDTGSGWS